MSRRHTAGHDATVVELVGPAGSGSTRLAPVRSPEHVA